MKGEYGTTHIPYAHTKKIHHNYCRQNEETGDGGRGTGGRGEGAGYTHDNESYTRNNQVTL